MLVITEGPMWGTTGCCKGPWIIGSILEQDQEMAAKNGTMFQSLPLPKSITCHAQIVESLFQSVNQKL